MKVEKLLTLSQFIDNLGYGGTMGTTKALRLVIKYNNFLKQPLKKEMFVNEAKSYKDVVVKTIEMCDAWQEAEKKVIFEGWLKVNGSDFICNESHPEMEITKRMNISINFKNAYRQYESLHDLAEATKGELKLKNVEL